MTPPPSHNNPFFFKSVCFIHVIYQTSPLEPQVLPFSWERSTSVVMDMSCPNNEKIPWISCLLLLSPLLYLSQDSNSLTIILITLQSERQTFHSDHNSSIPCSPSSLTTSLPVAWAVALVKQVISWCSKKWRNGRRSTLPPIKRIKKISNLLCQAYKKAFQEQENVRNSFLIFHKAKGEGLAVHSMVKGVKFRVTQGMSRSTLDCTT